jgi:hypothetical protein
MRVRGTVGRCDRGGNESIGPVLTIVIGLVLVVGGLSGQLVFAGSSDSGPLLAVLGAALIVYQFWKARQT